MGVAKAMDVGEGRESRIVAAAHGGFLQEPDKMGNRTELIIYDEVFPQPATEFTENDVLLSCTERDRKSRASPGLSGFVHDSGLWCGSRVVPVWLYGSCIAPMVTVISIRRI